LHIAYWIMGGKVFRLVFDTIAELYLSAISWADARIETAPALELEILSVYDSLQLPLLRYSISFGLPAADGEDIVQETFLALFDHLRKGRSRDNLRGWVFRVTHNLALKRRRFYRNQSALISVDNYRPEDYLSDALNPEQIAIEGEHRARLVAIYKALPENDRLILQLRAEGLTYREIAHVVGVSLGTVSNLLERSLSRLALLNQR
jgi:RNA polymerase sigma-70 factor, ECF subfamily